MRHVRRHGFDGEGWDGGTRSGTGINWDESVLHFHSIRRGVSSCGDLRGERRTAVRKKHLLKMLPGWLLLGCNVSVLTCTAETGVLCACVIHFPHTVLNMGHHIEQRLVEHALQWTHYRHSVVSDWLNSDLGETGIAQFRFWETRNRHVVGKGPLQPVINFLYVLQVICYSLKLDMTSSEKFSKELSDLADSGSYL